MQRLPMPQIHLVPSWLTGQERSDESHTIVIDRFPCVLGRSSGCDHRIDDPMISRRHCAFSFRDGKVWVEDLFSCNVTRLDGEPVMAARPLVDGATLHLAHLPFTVRQQDFTAEHPVNPPALVGARTGEIARGDRG
jgi:predicted component of type VI protein secretion system